MLKKREYIFLSLTVIVLCSFFIRQKTQVGEYIAKAAFIFNFTKFVEWEKSEANTPTFVIGVIGDSPIQQHLSELAASKTINNKKIEIVKCGAKTPSGCKCQILFVPETVSTADFQNFISELTTKNVLIISERKGFLDQGSAINFLVIENRIKFEISMQSLNKSNLKASSQLLKLATAIQN
ncbi:MAG: putative transrane protein [Bacteroidota bacterium]|jgi:hypothetical protein|nr:putative transrane protein [Bacteroidota bacterium]